MDKKNTILLTVIAVATLLVAVVGATFAYFSVTNGSSTSSTTVTGKTPNVGIVSFDQTKNSTLYLKPTAEQMSSANQSQKYYAVTPDGNPATTAQNHTIATLKVDNGDDDVSYSCTAKMTISVTGTMADKLTANDAFIKLSAPGSTGFNNAGTTEDVDFTSDSGVALKDIVDNSDNKFDDLEVGFSLKKGTTDSIDIKGDVWLVNTTSVQNDATTSAGANDISNKELTVKVEFKELSCDLAESV